MDIRQADAAGLVQSLELPRMVFMLGEGARGGEAETACDKMAAIQFHAALSLFRGRLPNEVRANNPVPAIGPCQKPDLRRIYIMIII